MKQPRRLLTGNEKDRRSQKTSAVLHRKVCLEAIASGTQQGTVLFFGVLVGVRLQIKNGASWVSLRSNCPCWRLFRSR